MGVVRSRPGDSAPHVFLQTSQGKKYGFERKVKVGLRWGKLSVPRAVKGFYSCVIDDISVIYVVMVTVEL